MRCLHRPSWILLLTTVMPIFCGIPTGLDLKLMKEVTTDLSSNHAISPFVMSTLMSQIWLATGGSTRDEITSALEMTEPLPNSFLKAYKSAIDYLSAADQGRISTAVFSRIYVRNGFAIKPTFNSSLVTYYGAGTKTFSSPSAGAQMINNDVAQVTNNRIRNLVSNDHLQKAQCVLVSALYFQGGWEHSFHPAKLENFLTKTGEKKINMMKLDEMDLLYANKDTYDAVALPYADHNYCMLIIRPVERSPAAAALLKKSLDLLDIGKLVDQMSYEKVIVKMPRFKIEAEYSLLDVMPRLGIRRIFNSGADFSGLTEYWRGLHVGELLHKVVVNVDEHGTVAAGAGAVFFLRSFSSTVNFTADRPFVAVLYNKLHKINMFTAYIDNPSD